MAESSSSKHSRSENSDIISSLPDHLLHHILSFLPINHAVSTSLQLSKRFETLALSMPYLILQDSSFSSPDSFTQFVDALLLLWKPINMFRLKCDTKSFKIPPVRINIWIAAVMNRKIQHLELSFTSSYGHIDVPSFVFHNQTIRILKLNMVRVNARSLTHLPALKVLWLERVKFSGPKSAYNILTGCPSLEQLVFQSYFWKELTIPKFEFQYLRSAKILLVNFSLLSALSNVKFLHIENCFIPKKNIALNMWSIPTLYALTELELAVVRTGDLNKFVECLGRFPNLEILNIQNFYATSWERDIVSVPQCVASKLQKFSMGEFKGLDCELKLVTFIMENSCDLRIISICCLDKHNADSKLQMLTILSSSRRASANCRLLFK